NDKNRLELNFVIPTVDLETGKRVQPYYHRADLNRVDAWKSLTNDVYRFTDPNDPAKRQTLTLKTNESSDRKSLKRVINEYASVLFANGVVNNRRELVDAIHQHGFNPTRMTKNSVTFTHPETNQKFRMTGAFYEESFRSREALQTADRGRDSESERDRKQ
ncbi:relaxase/mobilization nuclease domain-containing protein, partial [Enterococcus faecium]|uniref:relaxase/mobilization nuclease domain-containing protein n=2 Tax=Bacillati TaxID=1783272 RepID=UPI0034E9511D